MATASLAVRLSAQIAEFQKAFQDASRHVDRFKTTFGGAASELQKHQERINRAVDGFSGDKIIREANSYAQAVQRVGGAAKLTETEQRRVNAAVTEAIAKYSALGQTAPRQLIELARATERVATGTTTAVAQMGRMQTTASAVTGAMSRMFGVGFGVAAGGTLIRDIISTADNLADLSDQTGITTTGLQRLQYAGNLVGVSLEQIVRGVGQMQNRIASLDTSALAGLRQLAIPFEQLEQLDTVGKLEAISTAIHQIEDPARRTQIAMDLFGRSGVESLPLLRLNLKEIGDEAERVGAVMSQDVVKAAADFDDQITRLTASAKGFIGSWVLGPIILGVRELNLAFGQVATSVTQTFDILHLDTKRAQSDIENLIGWVQAFRGQLGTLPQLPRTPTGLTQQPIVPIPMSLEEADRISEGIMAGIKKQQQAFDEAKRRADAFAASVAALGDRINGVDVAGKAKEWAAALKKPEAAAKVLADEALRTELVDALDAVVAKFGTLEKAGVGSLNGIYIQALRLPPVINGVTDLMKGLADIKITLPPALINPRIPDLSVFNMKPFQIPLPTLPPIPTGFWNGLFNSQQMGSSLASAIMGAIQGGGNIVAAAGSSIGTQITSHLAKTLTGGLGISIQGALGGAINAILPVLGTLLGPLAGAIGGFFGNLFDRNKGRDIVENFAASFGGFGPLHDQLLRLGDAGEQLWIKLTQKVGRNNPQQAQAAIAEVTAALATLQTGFNQTATVAQSAFGATQTAIKEGIAGQAGQSFDEAVQAAKDAQQRFAHIDIDVPMETVGDTPQVIEDTYSRVDVPPVQVPVEHNAQATITDIQTTFRNADVPLTVNVHNTAQQAVEDIRSVISAAEMPPVVVPVTHQAGVAIEEILVAFRELVIPPVAVTFAHTAVETVSEILDTYRRVEIPALSVTFVHTARETVREILDIFRNLKVPPIVVPVQLQMDGSPTVTGGGDWRPIWTEWFRGVMPRLGDGGIVREPTLALVGEKGPEVVAPLNSEAGRGITSGGNATTITFGRGAFEGMVVDSDARVEQLATQIAKKIRRNGKVREVWRRELPALG